MTTKSRKSKAKTPEPEVTIIVRAPMNVKVVIRQEDITSKENEHEQQP